MHERILICHARIHQPLEAITVPSVEPIAILIQVTLQELDIVFLATDYQLGVIEDNHLFII